MADPTFDVDAAAAGADWVAIEDAFFDWIAAVTGLDESRIRWVSQGVFKPEGTVVALTLVAVVAPGVDAHIHTYDAGQPLNTEIIHAVVGPRTGTLRVQHYGGDATGNAGSRAVLGRCLTALRLPGRTDAFAAAGVGILDAGPVQDVSAVDILQIEPRAMMDVRFSFMDSATEQGGYIATADPTVTVNT